MKLCNGIFDSVLIYKHSLHLHLYQISGKFCFDNITYTHLISIPIYVTKLEYTLNLISHKNQVKMTKKRMELIYLLKKY